MTHVLRLNDKVKRTGAVIRLIQFFEDAMTKDKRDLKGKHVKPLLDKIVKPMAAIALSGELDKRTQGKLLRFLADTRDERAAEALVKAITDYKPTDKRPEPYDDDIAKVVSAVGKMKLKAAGKPILSLFERIHASWPVAQRKRFYLTLHETLVELANPEWETQLIAMIKRPIKTMKNTKVLRNEVYWQTTSAKLLGNLKSKKAVKPLIKVVLSPLKADIARTAVVALIKIGKPTIDAGVKLLNGEDKELIKYSEEENLQSVKDRGKKLGKKAEAAAKVAHVGAAAIIIATVGRKEAVGPMLQAIEKGNDLTKAIIARELPKVPKSPEVVQAFQKVYDRLKKKLNLTIPPGAYARETLAESSSNFFDANVGEYMIKDALKLKGPGIDEADAGPVQQAALSTAIKLATMEQWPQVEKLAKMQITSPQDYRKRTTIGKAFEKELKIAKESLEGCKGKGVECWLAKLVEEKSQKRKTQFQGIKAAYMLAIKGDEKTKDKIVAALPKVNNPAVRFVTAWVLDHLSPKGDNALADKLEAIVKNNEASRDKNKIQADHPLKTVIHRLRARAQ